MLTEKGGRARGITDVSSPYISVVRELLDNGEDVRHVDHYRGEFMLIADKRGSISSIAQQKIDSGISRLTTA